MPSANIHARFVQTARSLIDKHGRNLSVVVQTNSGSEFDPVLAETTIPIVAVQTKYSLSEVDGDLVKKGDVQYLIDSDEAITGEMRIRDGSDYSIVDVTEIVPGTTSILYKVQARI